MPAVWEAVCIALHDVGHIGRQYLDDQKEKAEHWRLGALLASHIFGPKGWALCAGHSSHSGEPRSALYKADKLSWTLAMGFLALAKTCMTSSAILESRFWSMRPQPE